MRSLWRWFRLLKLKLIREKGSGYFVAMGAVVGLMVGMIIPMGGQTFIALFLAWILKVSKTAACTFTFISNPWSVIFIYPFQIWFGGLFSGIKISQKTITHFIDAGNEIDLLAFNFSAMGEFLKQEGSGILINFVIGGAILGLIVSFATYPLLIRFLNSHQKKRAKRIQLRAEKREIRLRQLAGIDFISPNISEDKSQVSSLSDSTNQDPS
jgi:uncharacterized protein (DUF2062 family)